MIFTNLYLLKNKIINNKAVLVVNLLRTFGWKSLDPVLAAFLLTAGAGLATGIGSAIPFFFKDFKKKYLAFFLGLSAGVMIIVSFMELMVNALQALESYWVYLAFFVGMGVVALIDFLIPHEKNLHHMQKDCDSISKIQEEC